MNSFTVLYYLPNIFLYTSGGISNTVDPTAGCEEVDRQGDVSFCEAREEDTGGNGFRVISERSGKIEIERKHE